MMFRALFVAFFGMVFLLPTAVFAAPLKNTLEISGWIPYWRTATGTADVIPHLDTLTTVHPFVYTLKNDGTINDAGGMNAEPWLSFMAQAREKKIRVIPTVMSGSGELLHKILSKYESRIKLEDDITALVMENNFDGIDIDFEAKLVETKPYFSLFLKGLYQRMGKKWVYCTIESRTPVSSRYLDTVPKDATQYANDYVAINKYCDRVQIMTYDQGTVDRRLSAAAEGPYVPVSDPVWVEKVIKLAAQTISKKKLVLGIPTYGYEWTARPMSGNTYEYDLLWAFNPRYALEFAAANGLTPTRNSAGELSFIYLSSALATSTNTVSTLGVPIVSAAVGPAIAIQQTFNIMWWSDSVAIAQKIAIAKKLGLRGVAIFKFDGGEDQRMWDLLK